VRSRPLSRVDWYGAQSNINNSALSALYRAAGRLLSEPCIMIRPSVVHTNHFHTRPRFFKSVSKTGNWSGIANVQQWALIVCRLVPYRVQRFTNEFAWFLNELAAFPDGNFSKQFEP